MLPKITNPTNKPTAHTGSNRVSVTLVIAFILVTSWITWLTETDSFQEQERFSEFYIKDTASLLKTNNLELSKKEESAFVVAIINHEGIISNYRIYIFINGHLISTVNNISLEDNQSSEKQIKFTFPIAGDNQRLDILLEKQGASFPYRSLHILTNVSSEKMLHNNRQP